MRIFLTGGGEQECFEELDRHFLSQFYPASKVLIIPQAAETNEFHEVKARIVEAFSHKNIESFQLLTEPSKLTWEELETFQGVLIEGGNTFQLINSVRSTPLLTLLKKFAQLEKPIYADSAGAILLGSDLHTAFVGDDADEDHLRLQDYRGFDLIEPWSVHAHYQAEEDQELEDMLYNNGSPIIALAEESGVLIQDQTIHSLGQAPATLFTYSGKEIILPGEKLSYGE